MATASSIPEQLQAKLEALLNRSAGIPPAGILFNFDNPPNLDVVLHAIFAIFIAITSLMVLIRVYTRHFLLRFVGYDDCKCDTLVDFNCSDVFVRYFRDRMGKYSQRP